MQVILRITTQNEVSLTPGNFKIVTLSLKLVIKRDILYEYLLLFFF